MVIFSLRDSIFKRHETLKISSDMSGKPKPIGMQAPLRAEGKNLSESKLRSERKVQTEQNVSSARKFGFNLNNSHC